MWIWNYAPSTFHSSTLAVAHKAATPLLLTSRGSPVARSRFGMPMIVDVRWERVQHLLVLCSCSAVIGLVLHLRYGWGRLPAFSLGTTLVLQVNSYIMSSSDLEKARAEKEAARASDKAAGINRKKKNRR